MSIIRRFFIRIQKNAARCIRVTKTNEPFVLGVGGHVLSTLRIGSPRMNYTDGRKCYMDRDLDMAIHVRSMAEFHRISAFIRRNCPTAQHCSKPQKHGDRWSMNMWRLGGNKRNPNRFDPKSLGSYMGLHPYVSSVSPLLVAAKYGSLEMPV